jgi:2-keto-4-pentenoate hydratase/2-oxohepta-3-ene-1,7-dioic acid hydratase in catechol pathway
MRILTYEHEGSDVLGLLVNDSVFNLSESAAATGKRSLAFSSLESLLDSGEAALRGVESIAADIVAGQSPQMRAVPLSKVRLCAPLRRPSKIVAIGLNYMDHASEAGFELPSEPLLFAKFPSSITGPHDLIVLPEGDPQVDFEAEMAVVIGRQARHVQPSDALACVAGFMVLNDVSARRFQFGDKQWTRGKSCDTFCPIGPWLTTRAEVPDPQGLRVVTSVNGEVLQDSNTRNLIFRVPELISYISRTITLEPGDIIATGTPPGVGAFRNPPRFLRPGDLVETEVEKLGVLRNRVESFVTKT